MKFTCIQRVSLLSPKKEQSQRKFVEFRYEITPVRSVSPLPRPGVVLKALVNLAAADQLWNEEKSHSFHQYFFLLPVGLSGTTVLRPQLRLVPGSPCHSLTIGGVWGRI